MKDKKSNSVLEVGAGIGRVTDQLLSKYFKKVMRVVIP